MSQVLLLSGSVRFSQASDISRNFSKASSRLSGFLSGCHLTASFLYAFLISESDAFLSTPKISQQSRFDMPQINQLFKNQAQSTTAKRYPSSKPKIIPNRPSKQLTPGLETHQQNQLRSMHKLRSKQKKKGIIVITQEQLAQERLIEISVMPENQAQINDVDIFVQKLSPKYVNNNQLRPTRSKSAQKRSKTEEPLPGLEPRQMNSFCNYWINGHQVATAKKPISVSTIKMACPSHHYPPKNSVFRKYSSQSSFADKEKLRSDHRAKERKTSFSLFSRNHEEKCESMRSRLKKNVNQEVVSAFQVSNIKLEYRFEHYIKKFQKMKTS